MQQSLNILEIGWHGSIGCNYLVSLGLQEWLRLLGYDLHVVCPSTWSEDFDTMITCRTTSPPETSDIKHHHSRQDRLLSLYNQQHVANSLMICPFTLHQSQKMSHQLTIPHIVSSQNKHDEKTLHRASIFISLITEQRTQTFKNNSHSHVLPPLSIATERLTRVMIGIASQEYLRWLKRELVA